MIISDLPTVAIAELNALAAMGAVDITSDAVRDSAFYRAIQTTKVLDSSFSHLPVETLLLVAQIAATSPTLHSVNMGYNDLGAHGPAVATALAASHTIHTVYMHSNSLGEHGPAVATALAASHTIHTVRMDANWWVGEYGSATEAVITAHNQETINLIALIHTPRFIPVVTTHEGVAVAWMIPGVVDIIGDYLGTPHIDITL